ncbi:phage tail tape measure protein [Streptomyces longwoodensis]|uniref:phage tail tape measure protein n=1 Tax=Streptomyces longwoodensis TaxID=68231 RepID=UPI00340A0816
MPNVGYATLQIIPSVRGIADDLRRQLVGPAGDAGEAAGEAAGGGFTDVFSGALAAIGVAEIASKIGEQFTEAFSQAMEQANVTSTLQAQLGASGADAAKYGGVVGRLYAKGITENFEQGAETVRAVVNAGLVPPGATTKQLDVISTKMTDVANTFGTDMSMQTQAVSALMKNNLAPSAGDALDLITVGLQKLGPNAEDLLETFQEYPVQLRKLGLDATTAMGLFQQGLQGGARDTDIIADSLKEFSIRSIDMSNSSRDAYKALGLNAQTMERQIAKGGDSATAGLQTVLDKLRGIHDPVKREAAAVGLFGTQAEELGASLFKLDPSKAMSTFSDVSGAADKLGKTLRSGPSYEITVFKRALQQGLVDFIGGQVLPILSRWGAVINRDVLPPVRTVGGVLASVFLPTVTTVGTVLSGTIGWFREWGIWLTPLAIAIGGVTLALNAQAIATGFVTAVFSVYRAAIVIGTAVTNGFAAAQAVLNAVMALNPITLVVIAVVALGAALVIAWKRSETFRSIVMGAWQGIQTAALWAWTNVLKPTIDGLVAGWKYVAAGALWLWRSVLQPVFGFISTAARIVATIYGVIFLTAFKIWWTGVKLYAGLVMGALRAVGGWATWLWQSAISPAIGFIVGGFKLWWSGVQLYFSLISAGFRTVGGWALWLWRSAVMPVVGWVVGGAKLMWSGVKFVFGLFTAGLRTLGGWATWLWRSAISPAMTGARAVISGVYNTGIAPVLTALRAAIGKTGAAFEAAKNAIKTAWDKVKGIAKAPVKFIIDTVYNQGLVSVWNKVASAFGAPKLSPYKFATGGPVFGAGTETSDDVPAWLSKNEHVWTAREVRGAGGHGAVMALRKWAAAGGSGPLPGFKDGGGLFGWIGKAGSVLKGVGSDAWETIKKGAKWLKDTLGSSVRAGVKAVVNPLLARIPGLDTGFGKMIRRIPTRMIDTLFGYADQADKKGASASFGGRIPSGQHLSIINAALRAAGVPPPGTLAQWQAGLNTLITRESGWNASAINRTDSNARAGHPSQGLAQTIPSTWSAYVPSSLRGRGILDPVGNVASAIRYIVSRYGNITRVQQANASKPPAGYDSGGWLGPGDTGVNHLRRPEAVLTPPQSAAFVQLAAAAAAARPASAAAAGAAMRPQPVVVEVHTRDEALAEFIDVRVNGHQEELIRVITTS